MSLEEIPLGIVRFEKIMADYKAAGGDLPGPKEMKEDLLKTLPQSFREQLMWHATSDDVTFDQFAEHIKKVSYTTCSSCKARPWTSTTSRWNINDTMKITEMESIITTATARPTRRR